MLSKMSKSICLSLNKNKNEATHLSRNHYEYSHMWVLPARIDLEAVDIAFLTQFGEHSIGYDFLLVVIDGCTNFRILLGDTGTSLIFYFSKESDVNKINKILEYCSIDIVF